MQRTSQMLELWQTYLHNYQIHEKQISTTTFMQLSHRASNKSVAETTEGGGGVEKHARRIRSL